MTGRGIDQILPHPSDPVLYESYVHDAREYVTLAEHAHGRIPRPVEPEYVWGDALSLLEKAAPDLRIINLETSVTTSGNYWPRKPVLYRMHPKNIACLTVASTHACVLANNHVLDWGYRGLLETLATLNKANLAYAGAGENLTAAAAPAAFEAGNKKRVLVFALGSPTAGVPEAWAAGPQRPGVNYWSTLSETAADNLLAHIAGYRKPSDVVIVSIHWGSNWGYAVDSDQVQFAHRLIDGGVAVVHGHSSHHIRPVELYHDGVIFYGCGDLITDYEGIGGYEEFRPDLSFLCLVDLEVQTGKVKAVYLIPMQICRFRLHEASDDNRLWLFKRVNALGQPFATGARWDAEGTLALTRVDTNPH